MPLVMSSNSSPPSWRPQVAHQNAYEEEQTNGWQHPVALHIMLLARLARINEAYEADSEADEDDSEEAHVLA